MHMKKLMCAVAALGLTSAVLPAVPVRAQDQNQIRQKPHGGQWNGHNDHRGDPRTNPGQQGDHHDNQRGPINQEQSHGGQMNDGRGDHRGGQDWHSEGGNHRDHRDHGQNDWRDHGRYRHGHVHPEWGAVLGYDGRYPSYCRNHRHWRWSAHRHGYVFTRGAYC